MWWWEKREECGDGRRGRSVVVEDEKREECGGGRRGRSVVMGEEGGVW